MYTRELFSEKVKVGKNVEVQTIRIEATWIHFIRVVTRAKKESMIAGVGAISTIKSPFSDPNPIIDIVFAREVGGVLSA